MAKKKMSKANRRKLKLPEKLSLSPQHINDEAWYYEERKGLHIVAYEAPIPGHARQVMHLHIPLRTLEASMKRYQAERRARRPGEKP